MRRLELAAGAPRWQGGRHIWSTNEAMRQAERELALQAGRARHRAAHLVARQASQSRGRPQALSLRFDSSSPAPDRTLPPSTGVEQADLTFIRRAKEEPPEP
jgi:hypothetical protein